MLHAEGQGDPGAVLCVPTANHQLDRTGSSSASLGRPPPVGGHAGRRGGGCRCCSCALAALRCQRQLLLASLGASAPYAGARTSNHANAMTCHVPCVPTLAHGTNNSVCPPPPQHHHEASTAESAPLVAPSAGRRSCDAAGAQAAGRGGGGGRACVTRTYTQGPLGGRRLQVTAPLPWQRHTPDTTVCINGCARGGWTQHTRRRSIGGSTIPPAPRHPGTALPPLPSSPIAQANHHSPSTPSRPRSSPTPPPPSPPVPSALALLRAPQVL